MLAVSLYNGGGPYAEETDSSQVGNGPSPRMTNNAKVHAPYQVSELTLVPDPCPVLGSRMSFTLSLRCKSILQHRLAQQLAI